MLLVLLPLAACKTAKVTYSTDYDAYHMFGDRLDAGKGVRVLCWPCDAEGDRFRCVEDRIDEKIGEQPVMTWPGDARLPGSAGSVTVILPPGASAALRSRGSRIADDLTRGSPWAGRHFVTADTSWQEVKGGRELAGRLEHLHDRAKEWRTTDSEDGFFLTWEDLSCMHPDVIVVMLEGDEDRHVVMQGAFRPSLDKGGWESVPRTVLSSEAILNMPAHVSKEGAPLPMVFQIVVPKSAGTEARGKAARLAADLLARPHTSVFLTSEAQPPGADGALPPTFQPPFIYQGLLPFPQPDGETGE